MDTVRITERSNTNSYLAVTLIVLELKPNPFSQLADYWFFSINVSISGLTGNRLLNNLQDAKSFPVVSTLYLTLLNTCARRVSVTPTWVISASTASSECLPLNILALFSFIHYCNPSFLEKVSQSSRQKGMSGPKLCENLKTHMYRKDKGNNPAAAQTNVKIWWFAMKSVFQKGPFDWSFSLQYVI